MRLGVGFGEGVSTGGRHALEFPQDSVGPGAREARDGQH